MLRVSGRPRKDHAFEEIILDENSAISQPLWFMIQCHLNFNADDIYDDSKCYKTAAMPPKIDWSNPPIYDEDLDDEGIALGELTSFLPIHNT
ncbi:hypothetical protein RHSIM_Rhsim02G0159800 [Rhododendron simsii]|uniref:Uncharacterized protein n=1 Tax=Rhododendron simsii TaxID=118357 RepID=A0A834HBI7_RHOSS|nr:hypothetical protein RHSIM_Rhsim02G0159800 [Rhododendron simsii]